MGNKKITLTAILTFLFFTSTALWAQTTVFESGQDGHTCYRIPAIVKVHKTLLAFAEGRKNSCSDFGNVDLLMKKSMDGGKTWSKPTLLVDYGDLQAGNPAPVFDRSDPRFPEGRLFLFYNTGNRSEHDIVNGKGVREVFYITSADEGESWSEPVNITLQVHHPNEPSVNPAYTFSEDWRHYANTPGHALQLANGTLFVPMNISEGALVSNKIPYKAGAFYSENHGESFRNSALLKSKGSNECTAVQLSNGEVILNARDQTEKTGKRYTARSKDNGQSWYEETIDPYLTDPVCEGSMQVIRQGKKEVVLLSQLFDPQKRKNLSLHVSYDGAHTWAKTITIDPESSAYSDLVVLSKKKVGVLYEKDDYGKIVFKTVGLKP